jgi:streptogramin lyase
MRTAGSILVLFASWLSLSGCGNVILVPNAAEGAAGGAGGDGGGGALTAGAGGAPLGTGGSAGAPGTGGSAGTGGLGGSPPAPPFELLVTSQNGVGEGSVKAYDEAGSFLRSIGGELGDPLDVAIAPDGNLLVSDAIGKQVVRFTLEGEPLPPLVSVEAPFGMTVVDGVAYVCEHGTGLVRSFDAVSGQDLGAFTLPGGATSMPTDVAVHGGKLYVSLWNAGTVEAFDVATHAALGTLFANEGPGPISIELGPNGDLYAASLHNGVRRYDAASGELVGTVVSGGEAITGIAFGPDGLLYVAGPHAVRRFGPDGSGGALFVQPSAGGLANPYHIAFGPALD